MVDVYYTQVMCLLAVHCGDGWWSRTPRDQHATGNWDGAAPESFQSVNETGPSSHWLSTSTNDQSQI